MRMRRIRKWWLLVPIAYLIGSAVVGTYLASRQEPRPGEPGAGPA